MIPSFRLGLLQLASGSRGDSVRVAIMISDTLGLWHADMIRSAAAWPRGAKSATGVLGLELTKWRFGINRRWQERGTWLARVGASSIASRCSLWIRRIPLLGNGSRRRVPCCPGFESHLALERPQCKQFKQIEKWAAAATMIKKNGPEFFF